MKVQILEPAYFNNAYLKKGEIVTLNIKKCPSWAKEIVIKEQKTLDKKEDKKENTIFGEEEQKEKLDKLLNEAIEKGILIEDADKKSVEEQIKELEELLKEEK
jgi:homoserine dehydrogenase